jgi:GNAT superfamily N-acetyltransferase
VWSINCFVVRAGHRKRGVGAGLLAAAIEFAKHQGAGVIEAYPVDGSRSSSVDYFTGTMSMFDEHGFVELIRRNDSRPMVRLTV